MRLLLLLSAILTALTGVVTGTRAAAEPVQASASLARAVASSRIAVAAPIPVRGPWPAMAFQAAALAAPLLPRPILYADRRRE